MSTRSRRKQWSWWWLIVVVVIGVGGYALIFGRNTPSESDAAPPGHPAEGAVNPADSPPPPAPPARPIYTAPPEDPEPIAPPAEPVVIPPVGIEPPEPEPAPAIRTPEPDVVTDPLVTQKIKAGTQMIEKDQLVRGRKLLNEALAGPISRTDATEVRAAMARVNNVLLFSPGIMQDDPYVVEHIIKPGDTLDKIGRHYDVPLEFIAWLNGIENPNRIRADRRLKIVKGPFSAVVDKSAFRLDVLLADLYVCSFPVGLGEHNSTPEGEFVVRPHSKLKNPEWTNPRTGEVISGSDPENPLGEFWIGLDGTDEYSKQFTRYGIHGTIEPGSIGAEASWGCIRLLPDDIEMLYHMVTETKSRVIITP